MPCEMWPASEMEAAFERTFPKSEYPNLPHFYCQGGFDYNRLGLPDKIAMRMFFKANAKAAESDPKAAEMLRVMKDGFDGTKREYLEPIIAYMRSGEVIELQPVAVSMKDGSTSLVWKRPAMSKGLYMHR